MAERANETGPTMFGWSAMDFWSSSWRSENGAQYLPTPSGPLAEMSGPLGTAEQLPMLAIVRSTLGISCRSNQKKPASVQGRRS